MNLLEEFKKQGTHEETVTEKNKRLSFLNDVEYMSEKEIQRTQLIWQIAGSLLTFFVLLELWGSLQAVRTFFVAQNATMNPFSLLLLMLKKSLLTFIIIVIVSYFIGMFLSRLRVSKRKKGSYYDAENDLVMTDSPLAKQHVMTDIEKRKVFDLRPINNPCDTIVGINKDTNEVICKRWGREDFHWNLANENVLVCGPSGMGKSAGLLKSNVLSNMEAGHSIVVFDPKGEIYKDTKGIALALGYKTKLLNLIPTEQANSDGWACLKLIRQMADADESAALQLIDSYVNTILEASGKDFWTQSNISLLTLVVTYVALANRFIPSNVRGDLSKLKSTRAGEESNEIEASLSRKDFNSGVYDEYRSWEEVAAIINTDYTVAKGIIEAAIHADPHDAKLLQGPFNRWAQNGSVGDQIMAGLANALSVFNNPSVVQILSSDDIDFDELLDPNMKEIIYVGCSGVDDTYKPILSLFVNSLFKRAIQIASKNGGSLDKTLFVVLEEFKNIGRIPMLSNVLAQNRSYNISIFICIQNIPQLNMYNTPDNPSGAIDILDSCQLQLCLGANSGSKEEKMGTATYFSARSGEKPAILTKESEYRDKWHSESLQDILVRDKRKSTEIRAVPVFSPGRIQQISPDEILISPGFNNSCIEKKYLWTMHPASKIKLINKFTGKEARFITAEHVSEKNGGTEDDMSKYQVVYPNGYEKRRQDTKTHTVKPKEGRGGETSRRSYRDFVKG